MATIAVLPFVSINMCHVALQELPKARLYNHSSQSWLNKHLHRAPASVDGYDITTGPVGPHNKENIELRAEILVGEQIRGTGLGAHHVHIRPYQECNYRRAPIRLNQQVPCRTARAAQGTLVY